MYLHIIYIKATNKFATLELGIQGRNSMLHNPKDAMNDLLEQICNLYKDHHNILLMDEIRPTNDKSFAFHRSDWSKIDTSTKNIDFLIALNPRGENFRCNYQVIPPKDPNTLSQQLFHRHRNCYEIALLIEHFKPIFINAFGILDSTQDILDKSMLPMGRLPVWIEIDERLGGPNLQKLKIIPLRIYIWSHCFQKAQKIETLCISKGVHVQMSQSPKNIFDGGLKNNIKDVVQYFDTWGGGYYF